MKCVEAGVDGLVVEGAEGGGFKNPEEVSTLVLLQGIRARTDVPMVAAGGICDGRGMAAAFALGAEGIQMGTRFVSCTESPVHANYKNAIVEARETGTLVLNKKSTPCIRALKSERTKAIYDEGLMAPDALKGIREVYFHGDMEAYFAAKQLLFEGAGGAPPRVAVLNQEDEWAHRIQVHPQTQLLWYGLGPEADLRPRHIASGFGGLRFDLQFGKQRFPIESP